MWNLREIVRLLCQMEMNRENMQLSKLEANYIKSCSEIFYRIAVLKTSANSQESTCFGVRFNKIQTLILQFC